MATIKQMVNRANSGHLKALRMLVQGKDINQEANKMVRDYEVKGLSTVFYTLVNTWNVVDKNVTAEVLKPIPGSNGYQVVSPKIVEYKINDKGLELLAALETKMG